VGAQLLESLSRLVDSLLSLKGKGQGNDAHGEYVEFVTKTGDYRGRSRAGSPAQSGRDKHHPGLFTQVRAKVLERFECRLAPHLRSVAGATARREIGAQLQAHGHRAAFECLVVGIAQQEFDFVNAHFAHMADGIATGAAHADDFDDVGAGDG